MTARRTIFASALLASSVSACSILYDPEQFRSTDAARGTDAWMDASAEPDANGALDASLDATVSRDGGGTDAALVDAVSADAVSALDAFAEPCFGAGDSFPSDCIAGLTYCDPETLRLASMPPAMAEAALPGANRLAVLGNAIEVARTDEIDDAIVDHELGRDGVTLRVAWIDSGTTTELSTRDYTVRGDGLAASSSVLETRVSGELVDLALAPSLAELAVVGRHASDMRWQVSRCSTTGCMALPLLMPPVVVEPSVAWTAGALIEAHPDPAGLRAERLDPSPVTSMFGRVSMSALRSSDGVLAYTTGALADAQLGIDPRDPAGLRSVGLGTGMPRLATMDIDHVVGRISVSGGNARVATLPMDCSGVECGCGPLVRADECNRPGVEEVAIVLGSLPLLDWSFHVTPDGARVAVLLVGNESGTSVLVAFWRTGGPIPTVTPIRIGSGRLTGMGIPAGVGRSIRTALLGSSTRLELMVATLVRQSDRDVIYLTGLRLDAC